MGGASISFSAASIVADQIDAKAGVIRGVSLITQGPALGHGVMVDAITLQQVKYAAEKYEGGLKVKLDHAGGAGDIIGFIDGLRIADGKLLGDLHLLKTSPHRDYVLELAEKIPDTIGLSIAFSGPVEMAEDKRTLLQRCTEIYSVDLVSEPAANEAGLFARLSRKYSESGVSIEIEPNEEMTDDLKKTISGMIESAMMSMGERLAKLEAGALKPEDKSATMSAQQELVKLAAKYAAEEALKEFAKTLGAPAANGSSSDAAPKQDKKSFEAVVAEKTVELKGNKAAAIADAIKQHPDLYAAYRTRVQAGEIIKL
jgi:hypothetical protein